MADIKCWLVKEKQLPQVLEESIPELEQYLEDWIENNPEILGINLLIIGRQVENIDLLAIDEDGQIVVIELKKDKLPREVIAQVLEYVAKISEWSPIDIKNIAEQYLLRPGEEKSFDDIFEEFFGKKIEETSGINSDQRIILVGCRIDPTLEKIINWLSERKIPINIINFSFFSLPSGEQIMVRSSLVSEEEIKKQTAERKGRTPPMSETELQEWLKENEIKELFEILTKELDDLEVLEKSPGIHGIDYQIRLTKSGKTLKRKAIQIIVDEQEKGELKVGILTYNLAEFLKQNENKIEGFFSKLNRPAKESNWRLERVLSTHEDCRQFVKIIKNLLAKPEED